MFLFWMFASHVKDQFADSRARLTPGFRRVHATVAAAAALLLAVLLPTVFIWLADLRSVGLVTLTVFLLGAILCSVALHSNLLSWLVVLGSFATFTEPARILLWQLVSGKLEAQAVALLALGAAITLIGGIRLVGLNEDMPAYHPLTRAGWSGRNRISGQAQAGAGILPRALQERLMENNMARWTNHARSASQSMWSRVCRWQVGMVAGWSASIVVLSVLLYGLIMVWMTGQDLRNADAVVPMMLFSLVPQIFVWSVIWRGRVPMLAYEVLLPVDRPTYVRQMGMAVAVGQFQLWAGMSVGIALWFLLIARQPFSCANLAVWLGIFAFLQPWFFGVGAWFVRYRHIGALGAGLALSIYVAMIPVGLCAMPGRLTPWRHIALPLAGIVALFGLLLTYDAYRRWLVTDFD
ncbi:MAG: hypothetical protein ACYC35_12225 [Pirellulales bacterium]